MTVRDRLLGVLVLIVAGAWVGPAPAATPEQVNNAIRGGVGFLKKQLAGGGGLGAAAGGGLAGEHPLGQKGLVGLALLEAGVPPEDPLLKGVADEFRQAGWSQAKTYDIALTVLFLDRYGDKADAPLIQVMAARLLAGQTANGGWGYDCPVGTADLTAVRAATQGSKEPLAAWHPAVGAYAAAIWNSPRGTSDDNSNTQFAVLALWVARRSGVPTDPALDLVEARFLQTQSPEGRWGYTAAEVATAQSSPSMICAGLLGLATGAARREDRRAAAVEAKPADAPAGKGSKAPKKPAGPPVTAQSNAIRGGLMALGGVLAAPVQAGGGLLVANGGLGNRDMYFLWSVERVGVIFGADRIGGVDWHAVGCHLLVHSQSQDGSWSPTVVGSNYSPGVNTAFAVMFLLKSNIVRDMSSKMNGFNGEMRAGGPKADRAPTPKGTPAPAPPTTTDDPPAPADDPAQVLAADLLKSPAAAFDAEVGKVRDAKGPDYTRALAAAIGTADPDRQRPLRDALATRLTRLTADSLRVQMKATDPEVRRAASLAAAMKDDRTHIPDLIDRVADDDAGVVRAARAGLKSLTGQDFGPDFGATPGEHQAAVAAWKEWWAKNKR